MSSKNFQNAVPLSEVLEKWGLEANVFEADEARKEERLDSVMEYPEWFFEVLGNVNSLNYVVITGPRGSGKSSIRRSIVDHCRTKTGNDILGGNVLCVSIDHDSSNWVKQFVLNAKKPSVDFFCEEIARQLIIAILTYSKVEELKGNLDKREAYLLERYMYKLQESDPDEISALAGRLLSSYKRVKSSEAVNDWIKILSNFFGNEVSFENRVIETDAIDDLPVIIEIVKKCDFDAIYILVDEIDEYNETSGKPDFAAEIIVPILSSINLLEKGSIGLKFFLSAPVYQRLDKASKELETEIRHDRNLQPEPYILSWSDESILTMLIRRSMTYSSDSVNSLNAFSADESIDVDKEIVKYSHHNPRHMIQLCHQIARYVARRANECNYQITREILDSACVDFCKTISKQLYPDKYVIALIEFSKPSIKDEEFAEANDIEIELARNILDEMTNLGALSAKQGLGGQKKYTICDPRVSLLVTKEIDID